MIAQLGYKNIIMRAYIRHISLSLEARIKRKDPEDYFRIPGPGREGAILKAKIVFEKMEIRDEILKREKRNIGEDIDFISNI
jgi:hypothetical protein